MKFLKKMLKIKISNWALMIIGMLFISFLAMILFGLDQQFQFIMLLGDESNITNYLELIGVSFSVTFITTSLLGGLSDKSEKIYWRSYPEHYLINSNLNFFVLSGLAFICLGIEVMTLFLGKGHEAFRGALFLSSFITGIMAIVILTYRFTAVFFRREKLLHEAERDFEMLITEDDGEKDEFEKAVIGIFNNTLEAASKEKSNLKRVQENIELLLKHDKNAYCSMWLTILIKEMLRTNATLLVQLVSIDKLEKKIADMILEIEGDFGDSSELDGVLQLIYTVRLYELKDSLGETTFFEDGCASGEKAAKWKEVGAKVNNIIIRIKTHNSNSNCLFLLEQFIKLPYDLLEHEIYDTVLKKWDGILIQFVTTIAEKNVGSYQKLQRPIFDYLLQHPNYYYDDTISGELRKTRAQLGDGLNQKTARSINGLSEELLTFMIDTIDNPDEKRRFLVWFTGQMADRNIPEERWGITKSAAFKENGKMD